MAIEGSSPRKTTLVQKSLVIMNYGSLRPKHRTSSRAVTTFFPLPTPNQSPWISRPFRRARQAGHDRLERHLHEDVYLAGKTLPGSSLPRSRDQPGVQILSD